MFGYHDNDRCGFDLWSPVDVKKHCEMSDQEEYLRANAFHQNYHANHGDLDYYDIEHRGFHPYCATENRAFSPYAKHTQEVEDVINEIVARYQSGNYSFTLDLDDDFSQEDVEYIQREVEKRIG